MSTNQLDTSRTITTAELSAKVSASNGVKTALLICDMQRAILANIQDESQRKQLISNCKLLHKQLLDKARSSMSHEGHQVKHIIHVHFGFTEGCPEFQGQLNDDAESQPSPLFADSNSFLRKFSEKMIVGSEAALSTEELEPAAAVSEGTVEPVVVKSRASAFSYPSSLQQLLLQNGIKRIVLCGFQTAGVILSTAREAVDKDYEVIVVRDACADFDAESHRVLMDKVLPLHTRVVSLGEAIASLL